MNTFDENEIAVKIGHKIRKLRDDRKYPQKYMAEELKISQPDYSDIEHGVVTLGIGRLFHIADILGVPTNDILDVGNSKVFNIHDNTTEKGINGVVYQGGISEEVKALYEKIIAEKAELNQHLKAENERLREEIERLRKG